MTQNEDLKRLERKAYKSYFDDGIWDIAWGIWLAVWAILPLLKFYDISRFYAYSLMFVPTILLLLGKKYLTVPRIGMVRFNPARRRRKIYIFLAGIATLALTTLLWYMTATGQISAPSPAIGGLAMPIIEAFGIFLILSALAFFIEFPRLYIYASMFATGIIITETLYPHTGEPWDALLGFGVYALSILCYGIIRLVLFLGKYPRPKMEVQNGLG